MRYSMLALALALLTGVTLAAPPKSDKAQKLTNAEWKGVSTAPLRAGEIDQLIGQALMIAFAMVDPPWPTDRYLSSIQHRSGTSWTRTQSIDRPRYDSNSLAVTSHNG